MCTRRGGGSCHPSGSIPAASTIDGISVSRLDPVFQLALHVARAAWSDARTDRVDGLRAGVILGNIVLPVESVAGWSREVLSSAYEEKLGLRSQAPRDRASERLSRRAAGRFRRRGLWVSAGRLTRSMRPARRRFIPWRWPPESFSPARPTPCFAAEFRGPMRFTSRWVSRSSVRSRREAVRLRLTRAPTAWSWAKAPGCSCSSVSTTHSTTAIGFTASSLLRAIERLPRRPARTQHRGPASRHAASLSKGGVEAG